jgi:hypothetical protein
MSRILLGVVLLCGCGHDPSRGLQAAQTGLAFVDVGTDRLVEEYIAAVQAIRAHCAGDEQCEEKYHVTDADVAKVTKLGQQLSAAYDQSAIILQQLTTAWAELSPYVEQVKAVANGLDK